MNKDLCGVLPEQRAMKLKSFLKALNPNSIQIVKKGKPPAKVIKIKSIREAI